MKYIYILIVSTLLLACNHSVNNTLPDEATLEHLLENNPDSLVFILEREINYSLLSDADKADYGWWITRILKKQNRSMVNDTLIHFTARYYEQNDSARSIQAYIWAAQQINWAGTMPREQRDILEKALEIADSRKDTLMVNEVVFQTKYLYNLPQDYDKLTEIAGILNKYKGGSLTTITNYNLLVIYNRLGNDKAFFDLAHHALDIAYIKNDWLTYSMARLYVEALNAHGRYREALQQLRKLESSKNPMIGSELRLNYISTFIGMNEIDSAQYYINQYTPLIERNRGNEEIDAVESILNLFRTVIDLKQGKNLNINRIGYVSDNILMKNRARISAEREQLRVQSRLIEDNLKLDIERGKLRQRFLGAGIVVLIIVVILIFVYQRKLLKKERSVQKAKEQLQLRSIQLSENESVIAENEQLINTLSAQLDESGDLKQEIDELNQNNEKLKQENKTLQKDIEQYSHLMDKKDREFAIYEKLTQENARLQERERFLTTQIIGHTEVLNKLSRKPRFIEEMQWPEIFQAVNQLFDGFTYRLHTDFPALNEEDIRYCCLIKLHLSTSVIATLTGISPSSVTKRKQRIKEKMVQQRHPEEIRKDQSLEIYLWNY